MHEALTAELSKISALKVISRTSTARYKDTDKPMPQIARELGVAGLIEGSVLREGDQVRITVQLIHGPSDRHVWAENYDRDLRGVLALHSDVARAIAREIQVALTPSEQTRLATARSVKPEAYEVYLKGRFYTRPPINKEKLAKAEESFQQAIALDPSYAPPYAELAWIYTRLVRWSYVPKREGWLRAKAAAQKALELDPTLGDAHAGLGVVKMSYDWDWAGAEQEFKRALELNPSSAFVHAQYGSYLASLGRYQEALAEQKTAESLDPLWLGTKVNVAGLYFQMRDYDTAIERARKALELDPNLPGAHYVLGRAYVQKALYAEGIAELEGALALFGGSLDPKVMMGYAYGAWGKTEQAQRILEELLPFARTGQVAPADIAIVLGRLGKKDEAFTWLERAYAERDSVLIGNIRIPEIDPLRDDPRFQDLLRRMNFPE